MRLRPAYQHERVVVGATLDAAIYAYENKIPLFFLKQKPPHRFEQTSCGASKLLLFKRLIFLLSLNGLVPVCSGVTFMKIEENELQISTVNAGSVRVAFDKAIVFDESGLSGLAAPLPHHDEYMVIDWFNVKSGACHDCESIRSESQFVNEVKFYYSDRIDGLHDKKDLVAFSYLSEDEVDMLEHSETFVRLKVLDMMREAGIRGAKNGIDPYTGPQKRRSLRIESASRDKINLTRPIYHDTPSIIFERQKNTDEDIELKLSFLI